jgi:hypothetical protein
LEHPGDQDALQEALPLSFGCHVRKLKPSFEAELGNQLLDHSVDLGANRDTRISFGLRRLCYRQKPALTIDKAIPGFIEVRFDTHFH